MNNYAGYASAMSADSVAMSYVPANILISAFSVVIAIALTMIVMVVMTVIVGMTVAMLMAMTSISHAVR